ncbi:MAG: nucleoside monophosphate kinase [Planctomycetes bacterium]|nr:nucleoside monophosphate kinase [Planctomycetota bacterium]
MPDDRFAAVLLFGVPGAGKGTQGKALGQLPGFFHLSSGDIFRSLDPESNEGRQVRQYSERGELVPDELTIRIWKNWLDEQIAAARFRPDRDLLLLDGIPRNVQQCEILEQHIQVLRVIHLAAESDEPMIQRIKNRALEEGRPDDANEEVIRRRFEVYRRESAPVLGYYSNDLIADVDPLGTPAEVLARVLQIIIPVEKRFLQSRSAG